MVRATAAHGRPYEPMTALLSLTGDPREQNYTTRDTSIITSRSTLGEAKYQVIRGSWLAVLAGASI